MQDSTRNDTVGRNRRLRGILTGTVAAIALTAAASASAQEVRIFTFEGYTDDAWVDQFEAATGCQVNVSYTGSVDEMFAKMIGSEGADYDLISIDTSLFGRYLEQGLLAPYDWRRSPTPATCCRRSIPSTRRAWATTSMACPSPGARWG